MDGGHDMINLSEDSLVQLIEGQFTGDWHDPAFAFGELLATYAVLGEFKGIVPEQAVSWVFSSLAIAECVKRDETDWDGLIDFMIQGYLVFKDSLLPEERVQVFVSAFEGKGVTH